jgi:micrococcal nuclease
MDGVAPDPWLLVHARRRSAAAPTASAGGGKCAASYPDECIPPPPPDLDCSDIPYRNFRVLWNVADPDPHHFDGDHDGIGCET